MTARDTSGATSDAASANATVANSAPASGTVKVKPAAPSSDDIVAATATGFSDADADALTYRYQWFRNGSAIGGASARTLDLSQPGNGDPGDRIDVDVTALDGSGGTSAAVRAGETVVAGASHAVASYGFEEPVGTSVVDESGGNDGVVEGPERTGSGRFGRALSFDGDDDLVTVPDSASIDLTTGMTLEAWVKPEAATDWRTVIFKESAGHSAYALYANGETDVPSVYLGGVSGALGTSELDPGRWAHLAATYDGNNLRLFVNGTLAGTLPHEGDLSATDGPLTFGGNHVWGEHFRGLIDEVRVYNRALSAAEMGDDIGRPVVAGTPAPPPDPGPDAIGSFGAPKDWPIVPTSLSLTSNGKIAAWDGFEAALNSEHLWDPATESFAAIPTGLNLFCAGQITIGDGRLLVVGGHVQAYEGIKDTNLFNPQTGTWARGADMSVARWYPTVTQLPDGRAFVVSGDNITLKEPGMSVPLTDASNTLPSIYNPATDTWTDLPQASAAYAPLPVHVPAAERQALRRGPGHHDAHLRPEHQPVVGGRPEPDRRPQRGHVPARQDPQVGNLVRSGVPRPGDDQPRRGDRHDGGIAGLAGGRADEVPALVPHAHRAARRQGAGDRWPDEHRRRRSPHGRPRGRDVESGHQHVDDDGLQPAAAPLPLVGDPAA